MREILAKIAEVDYYVRWYSGQHDLGIWPSRQLGGSAEFETISEYQVGDNPRSINWAATARTGGTNLAVFLLVDLSQSMDFGTVRVTKRRLAAELSAILAHAAWRCHDRVGFIGYGSDVRIQWPLRNPKDYRLLIPQKVLETRSDGNGGTGLGHGGTGLGRALSRLPTKRSLVFLISDFQEDFEGIESALKRAALLHDLVSIVIWDPRERILPERWCIAALKDLETGRSRAIWLGGMGRKAAFQKRIEAKEQGLKALFRNLSIDALWVNQETDYVSEIGRLFLARRRAH
jgi:uncharacterized protein (DUF58 family)